MPKTSEKNLFTQVFEFSITEDGLYTEVHQVPVEAMEPSLSDSLAELDASIHALAGAVGSSLRLEEAAVALTRMMGEMAASGLFTPDEAESMTQRRNKIRTKVTTPDGVERDIIDDEGPQDVRLNGPDEEKYP